MYKLVIQDDEGKTTVVPLIRDELTIGRKEGNTIRLTERNVSRRHAKVLRSNGSITIEDLDSYNGIRVNGARIQGKVEIKETDRVQIGDYLIEIKAETAMGETPTQPISAAPLAEAVTTVSEAATVPHEATATAIVAAPPGSAAAGATTQGMGPIESPPGLATAETPPGPQPIPSTATRQVGRLVVLSVNFAGREFELDKPAMVIGRTDENDIWINHRSISRHHAKIVRENGRYAIVDLQSSNGVRVNGEEYGKVELRRGDTIDLGHVRLRYVEPGEDFLFGRDAHAVDLGVESGGRSGTWLFLIALLVAGGIGAFVIFGKGDSEEAAAENGDDIDVEETMPVVEQVDEADAASVESAPSEEVRKHLEDAIAARDKDDWEAMKAAAEAALELAPDDPRAKEMLQQATMEAQNQAIYKQFEEAVAGRKWAQVAELYNQLDDSSVYRVKAQGEHDRLYGEYRNYQLGVGKKLAAKNDCKGLEKLKSSIVPGWPEIAREVGAIPCKSGGVAKNGGGGSSGGGGTSGGGGGGNSGGGGGGTSGGGGSSDDDGGAGTGGASSGGASYDELMAEAKEAAKNTHFGKALRLCQQALGKKPGDQEATMVCAIASCNLKKETLADKYVGRIKSSSRKSMARQICLRNGVDI